MANARRGVACPEEDAGVYFEEASTQVDEHWSDASQRVLETCWPVVAGAEIKRLRVLYVGD